MVKNNLTLNDITLPKAIFAVKASAKLLSQYVYVYLNNTKKGFSHTKTRSQVTGSTRKIARQKGTGRARHGDIKAPIFVGGGVAFGPLGLRRKLKLTKKMRRKALFASLTNKLQENKIILIKDLALAKIKKTKQAQSLLDKSKFTNPLILVLPHQCQQAIYFQNLPQVKVNEPCSLNAYKVMQASSLIFTEKALSEFISLFKI